jgi:hypothetical protein
MACTILEANASARRERRRHGERAGSSEGTRLCSAATGQAMMGRHGRRALRASLQQAPLLAGCAVSKAGRRQPAAGPQQHCELRRATHTGANMTGRGMRRDGGCAPASPTAAADSDGRAGALVSTQRCSVDWCRWEVRRLAAKVAAYRVHAVVHASDARKVLLDASHVALGCRPQNRRCGRRFTAVLRLCVPIAASQLWRFHLQLNWWVRNGDMRAP